MCKEQGDGSANEMQLDVAGRRRGGGDALGTPSGQVRHGKTNALRKRREIKCVFSWPGCHLGGGLD